MKFIRLFSRILLALLLLASCEPKPGGDDEALDPDNPVTISLWHYYNGVQQTALDSLVKEFNSTLGLEKGIIVEAFSYGNVNDLSESVHSSAKEDAGALPMPDLFSSYADSAYELAVLGKLAYLDGYLTEEEKREYIPSYLEEGTFLDGYIKILPVAKATEIFMLNRSDWDKFEQAVSLQGETLALDDLRTWEGLARAAELYYDWSGGKALFGIDYAANYFLSGASQLGHETIVKDGETYTISLDEETMRRLWDGLYVPIVKGHFAAYGRFRSDDVKTGSLLAFIGSTSSAAYFPTEINTADGGSYPIEAFVAPVPVFQGADKKVMQQGAGMCVSKSTPIRELAAMQFLKWFTEVDVNTRFSVSAAGYFPVKQEAISGPLMAESIEELKNSGEAGDRVLADVMTASLLQLETYELLTMPVMEHSVDLRTILEGMDEEALRVREELLKKAEAGSDYDTEIRTLTDGKAFELWYEKLCERVNNL